MHDSNIPTQSQARKGINRSDGLVLSLSMKHLNPIVIFLVVILSLSAVHGAETKTNWQAEWERTVQAAKKEGSLSL